MTKKSYSDTPDPIHARDELLANRKHFVTYNIMRLRELLRYLSAKKLELFHTVPMLLHINSPDFPGYVDDPQTPHGIYRFHDSGFWKLARKRLGIEKKHLPHFISKAFCMKGVYLIGSAGSLGQTEYSDFDYWVVVDSGSISKSQRVLLRKKLSLIENWAEETYGHHLTFFALDSEQVQKNNFSGLEEEGFRTPQKSLLKEEFYRTFVLIAGQIPFWAILPVGLKDAEYEAWVETAAALSGESFSPDDYVDLGNLTSIEREECYGSLLWQFCKAQDDPAKALIKTSLMAHHFFSQEREGLLCDVTKKMFPECRLDSYALDPYALAFDRVLKFYEGSGDEGGLDLIRQCIYLRIVGYPVPFRLEAGNPKSQLLRRYIKEWSWGDNRIERLQSYASWPENERLQFESSIIAKLWDLYRQIFRSTEKPGCQTGMTSEDLAALRNKAASRFKKKPGKIPYASMYVRTQEDAFPVFVASQKEDSGVNSWTVYDGAVKGSLHKDAALFAAPELLRVLGWIVFNGLYNEKLSTVDFKRFRSPISPKRAKQLLDEVFFFHSNRVSTQNYHSEPRWLKVFVALDTSRFPSDGRLLSADYLIQNTWGEVFFRSSDLRHIENKLLKYHEIAKQIWEYLQDADPEHSSYQVVDLRTVADPTTAEAIKDSLDDFQKTAAENVAPGQTRPKGKSKRIETQKGGVILDLF